MKHFLATWMVLLFCGDRGHRGRPAVLSQTTVKLLVGLLAGGGLDVLARIVRQRVSEQWG